METKTEIKQTAAGTNGGIRNEPLSEIAIRLLAMEISSAEADVLDAEQALEAKQTKLAELLGKWREHGLLGR